MAALGARNQRFSHFGAMADQTALTVVEARMERRRQSGLSRILGMALFALSAIACHNDQNLLTVNRPAQVLRFEVSDSTGRVLWRISSRNPRELREMRYGVVPPEFDQEVPPRGELPRHFVAGEPLRTETVTVKETFVHKGSATDASGFRGGYWEASPHRRPTVAAGR